jgi:hypothetical protein
VQPILLAAEFWRQPDAEWNRSQLHATGLGNQHLAVKFGDSHKICCRIPGVLFKIL